MADVTAAFLQGHAAGQAEREHNAALEQNKLHAMILKHQLDALKIDDAMRGQQIAASLLQLREGRSAPDGPMSTVPAGPSTGPSANVGWPVPGPYRDAVRPDGTTPAFAGVDLGGPEPIPRAAPVLFTGQPTEDPPPTQQVPTHGPARWDPVVFPALNLPEVGITQPATSIRPRTDTELAAATARAELTKSLMGAHVLPAGSVLNVGGQTIASGGAESKLSPWDTWMRDYPAQLGKASWDALTPEERSRGFTAFNDVTDKASAENRRWEGLRTKELVSGANALTAEERAWMKAHQERVIMGPVAQAGITLAQSRGGNAALANVPPHLIGPAVADSTKAGNAYVEARQAADDMQTFITDVRAGNKQASAYITTEGVLVLNTSRGVKRINQVEIASYGGAGSWWDRLQGFFGKATSGVQVPPAVLGDIEALHKSIAQNATTAYQRHLDVINQNYGSEFKPVKFTPVKDEGGGMVRYRAPDGVHIVEAPAGTKPPPGYTPLK